MDDELRKMISEGSFLFDSDFSNDLDGFSDDIDWNIFEHSNIRPAKLGMPSLIQTTNTSNVDKYNHRYLVDKDNFLQISIYYYHS